MIKNKINYKQVRSTLYLKYGVDLDETSMSILVILYTELVLQFQKQNGKLDTATKAINHSTKSLQADRERPAWQAFWFGMGKWGIGLCLGIFFTVVFYCIHFGNNHEIDTLNQQLAWYKKAASILRYKGEKDFEAYWKNNPYPENK